MAAQPYNASLFLADFLVALEHSNWPAYPTRKWWSCLRQADEHDLARRLTNYYQSQDVALYCSDTSYFDQIYETSSSAKMNGVPLVRASLDESYC